MTCVKDSEKRFMKHIRKRITQLENDQMDKQLVETEKFNTDSRKCNQSVRTLKTKHINHPSYKMKRSTTNRHYLAIFH